MRTIEINLSSNPFRNDTPLAALLVVLALAAGGFTAWNAWSQWSGLSRRAALEELQAGQRERMQKMNAELARLRAELARVDEPTLATQAAFVSGILQQRNFSWTRLFDALERVTPWHSRLVAVRPVFEQGAVHVVLDGVSQDTDAFLALQDAFLHAPQFTRVQPGDFQKMPADQRIFFNLRATFLPDAAAPGETDESAPAEDVASAGDESAGTPDAPAADAPTGAAPARAATAQGAPPSGARKPSVEPAEAPVPAPTNQVAARPVEATEAPPDGAGAGAQAAGAPVTPADRRSLLRINPNQSGQPPQRPRRPPGGEPAPGGDKK